MHLFQTLNSGLYKPLKNWSGKNISTTEICECHKSGLCWESQLLICYFPVAFGWCEAQGEIWKVGNSLGFFISPLGLRDISSFVSSTCTSGILLVLISASSSDIYHWISQLFFHPCKQSPALNSFCLKCWNDFFFSWSDFVWYTQQIYLNRCLLFSVAFLC